MYIYYKGIPTRYLEERIRELQEELRRGAALTADQQASRRELITDLESEIRARREPFEAYARRETAISDIAAAMADPHDQGASEQDARQRIVALLREMRALCAEKARSFETVSLNSSEDGRAHAIQMAHMIADAIREIPIPE